MTLRLKGTIGSCAGALVLVLALGACDANGELVCDPVLTPSCLQPDADVGVADVGADVGSDTTEDVEVDIVDPNDLDGDGIPNDVEGEDDPDGDGIPNYLDEDSDGDGLPDIAEGDWDDDEDGIIALYDTDSDNDGFLDGEEGAADIDGDGLGNYRDIDSDGDDMLDAAEGDVDSDGDGILDRYDTDSDGDTIPDVWERTQDSDEDGIPNYLDLDSDNDGLPDADEYGRAAGSGLRPRDVDNDGLPDYIDLESDGDSLPDSTETGCPETSEASAFDSDSDGIPDLLEIAFANGPEDEGQACDPLRGIDDDVDFFFQLPFEAENPEEAVLEFVVDVRQADIAFNMDTTGSMGGEISNLQSSLTSEIIPGLADEIADSAYAFSQFDDFPCSPYGGGSDEPFILLQRVTTDVRDATAGVNSLERHGGGDYFESGYEAIYQICTGVGRNAPACNGTVIPPFDPDEDRVEGEADGEIGGVGFRQGALPIIVHMTDAPAHAKGDEDGYPYGASRNETFAVMRSIGAKLIGVASGNDARADLESMALQTSSTVPACAWTEAGTGARPIGCAESQCCTGAAGTGRAPVGEVCPLVYDIQGTGDGLGTSVVAGIAALVNFAEFDVTTTVVPEDPSLPQDASRFIQSVVPISATTPENGCGFEPEIVDLDEDGVDDLVVGVVAGSQVTFRVTAYNDFVPPTNRPQTFNAYIDVVQRGGAILDRRTVTILVPPEAKLD